MAAWPSEAIDRPRPRYDSGRLVSVTLVVSADGPAVTDELKDAFVGLPGVERVLVSWAGDRGGEFAINLASGPNPAETVLRFRDSIEGIGGIRRILITEFVDHRAAFIVVAHSEKENQTSRPRTRSA